MKKIIKRLFDLTASFFMLVILSPVFFILSIIIKIKMGSPVIFKQERPGKYGKIFVLYKFRTMTGKCNAEGRLLSDTIRLTEFGKFLRKTSLDEIPELWNILKGDMSFVGPRPLLVQYLDRYSPEQARRHEVKPGLTGWAQVNGRNSISWEEKFKLDVWYVDNWSLLLDTKILFMTFSKVLSQHGVAAEGEATMSEFKGDKEN